MGVVLSAYGKAIPVEGHVLPVRSDGVPEYPEDWWEQDGHEDGDHRVAFAYAGMEQSLDGLMAGQCYEVQDRIEALARSYTGYGIIREHICHAVLGIEPETVWHNAEEYRDKPMYEFINFADNEGCIGPAACARLAADFEQNREKFVLYAESVSSDDTDDYSAEELVESYDRLAEGFRHAADTGLVHLS